MAVNRQEAQKEYPLVSLVVLNYNGEDIIEECVASLQKTVYPNYEIIVVDNASADNSCRILSTLSGISLVKSEKNLGYAGGNNLGFEKAKGAYLATINNDIIVEPQWLNAPVAAFESDKEIGIVSCRQMDFWHREIVDALFGIIPPNFAPFHAGTSRLYSGLAPYHHCGLVLLANGASAIYRKKCLDEIGTFDERYFAYHEESDLCLRAFLDGWKCLYLPSAVVYHRHGHTFNKQDGLSFYLSERNRYWFMYKFFPVRVIFKNILPLIKREMWALLQCCAGRQRFRDYLASRMKALSGILQFGAERKRLTAKFKVREREFALFHKHPFQEYDPPSKS